MKEIYIVLTRPKTIVSTMIIFFSKSKFTHASISLDENLENMFSFGRIYPRNPIIGGFVQEKINEGVFSFHSSINGAIISIDVTNEQYEKAEELINYYKNKKTFLKYNYFGLITNYFNYPKTLKNSFLCSEFVYHILNESGIVDWGISRNLVRPQDLFVLDHSLVFSGDLKKYYNNKLYFV